MFHSKLIRILCLALSVVACSLILFGCSEEKTNDTVTDTEADTVADTVITYPENISAIADFKCVCSTDHKTEFVIENDDAKALYTYIVEQREKAEKTQIDRTEQDYIYLSFQDGEPFLILNQEPKAETSDTLAVLKQHFYGVFWIHENDYMVYTAMPMTSFQMYYKMPTGTYDKITELVKK